MPRRVCRLDGSALSTKSACALRAASSVRQLVHAGSPPYAAAVARANAAPPRPIAPGDVVTGWSVDLGEWTAAQITPGPPGEQGYVGVLALGWSGPRPATMADLDGVVPVRRMFDRWNDPLAHHNAPWLLPRSAQVIGALPLLATRPSSHYGADWQMGAELAWHRLRDTGVEDLNAKPWAALLKGDGAASRPTGTSDGVREVFVTEVDELDCARLVDAFPAAQRLFLYARNLGTLRHARRLNELHDLREISIFDFFGMDADDVLQPAAVPRLEILSLEGIPRDYATATRARWRREVRNGTALEVRGARTPEWILQNRTNPLRDWDQRDHITASEYRRSLEEYRRARAAIGDAFASLPAAELSAAMERIGVQFAEAINAVSARTAFVETDERDDLLDALAAAVEAAGGPGAADGPIGHALLHAVNAHREW